MVWIVLFWHLFKTEQNSTWNEQIANSPNSYHWWNIKTFSRLTFSVGCVWSWVTCSWRSSGSSHRHCRWRWRSGRSWRGWSECPRHSPRTWSSAPRPRRCSQSWWRGSRTRLENEIIFSLDSDKYFSKPRAQPWPELSSSVYQLVCLLRGEEYTGYPSQSIGSRKTVVMCE